MSKNILALVVVAICFVLIAVILVFVVTRKKPLTPITIAEASQPSFSLIYIASRNGYFREQGLDVNLRRFSLGKEALEDVMAGNSDLATAYEAPVVKKIIEGEPVGVLTALHRSTQKNTALLALKAKGITSEKDLRNKRIAVPSGTSTELFFFSILNNAGIQPQEVEMVDLAGEEAVKALRDGLVDAAALYSQYLIRAQKMFDMDDYVLLYSDSYFESSVLVGKKDYLLNNEETLTKLFKALVRAENFLRNNPQASSLIVAKELDDLSPAELQEIWSNVTMSLRLDNMLLTIMNRHAHFYSQAAGKNTNVIPLLSDYLITDYLKKVKPEGVTVY